MPTMTLFDFVDYLQSVWGLLAGVSTFLPFIGSLLKVLPAPYDSRVPLSVVSTIACAFSVYFSFMISPFLINFEYYVILASGILFVIALFTGLQCIGTKFGNDLYMHDQLWSMAFVITFWFFTLSFSLLAAMDYLHQVFKL